MTDLRLPVLAGLAWGSALAAGLLPARLLAACVGALLVGAVVRRHRLTATHGVWALAAVAVGASTCLQAAAVSRSPVVALARAEATVTASLQVRADPRLVSGRFGNHVVFRAVAFEVAGRGLRHRVRVPLLVVAPEDWRGVRYRSVLAVSGRLGPASGGELAGVLTVRGPPVVLSGPGAWVRGADEVRAGIRDAVARQPPGPRALLPALVDGEDGGLDPGLQDDFRTTGLTHLLAVSGTNLTLVVGFLLVLARAAGVRARGLIVVGALGVVGFVLLARPEPSVVRAAAMGSVALLGMGSGGRARGGRALGAGVFVVLLVDPWLARSPGFALSASATAGILFLAPGWCDALMRWLPRWLAEAIAVPLAAQLVCTPLVAALSGQVSLVAVVANLLVAEVVGPATVLGLGGGLLAVGWVRAGQLVAVPAGWCAGWIIAVARHASALPVAAGDVGTGPGSLFLLTAGCFVAAMLLRRVLARRGISLGLCGLLVVVVLMPLPVIGWPPRGWLMVACDIGQGDGLVLRTGARQAVVVDTGPDPRLMSRCLRRLHIDQVPLVVLTHFHADHIDGLPAVLSGHDVRAIEVSPYSDPEEGAAQVHRQAAAAGVPVITAQVGEQRRLGSVSWQVLAPLGPSPADSDSPPNDESVVLYVVTGGLRLLLMGDEETGSQERLHAAYPDLRADVLKVAHHGSAKQDPDLVRSLGARWAVISVGVDNDYGHPAPSLLRLLRTAGMSVRRTDVDGEVAVVADGRALLRSRR